MSGLRIGVIGVGALGQHHARILKEMNSVELVAVVDPDPTRGQAVANKLETYWAPDYRMLLDKVDAVSVVVPTVAHLDVAAAFLEVGIPTLVEKPLAATVDQARSLVSLAARSKTILQVGHIERFNPAFRVAASWCAKPKYIRAERTAPYTFRSIDIGVVHDLMIHDIDLVHSLVASEVSRVEAFAAPVMGSQEDAATARIYFQNGCIADLTASRVSPTVSRTMQVWSADGCVAIDMNQRCVTRYSRTSQLKNGPSPQERLAAASDINLLKQSVFGELIQVDSIPVTGYDALTMELTDFVEAIRHHRSPLVDGAQGLKAMETAGLVMESIRRHDWHQDVGPTISSRAA